MNAPRNVGVLALAQALALAGAPLVVLVGGIVSTAIAPSDSLATVPIATMVVGTALASMPAALLMQRIGRRAGFAFGAAIAVIGSLFAAHAIVQENFLAFCVATLLIGANTAFMQQYRFAAMESVPLERASRAVSWVLVGGVFGGLLGPELARQTRHMLSDEYAGSFVALAIVYVVVALLFALILRDVRPQTVDVPGPARPPREIAAQPTFRVALAAGVVAYAAMSLLMTATPVSMHVMHAHSLDATAAVIQSHVVAMYLPSLFTGRLIARIGAPRTMQIGVGGLFLCVAFALSGHALQFYFAALILLGAGWNLLWVGATVLLGQSYRPEERFRAQAVNDFTVFAVQAVASLSAGAMLGAFGWRILAASTLPALALVFVLLVPLLRARVSVRAAVSANPPHA